MGPSIMDDTSEKDLITICGVLNALVADFMVLGSHVKQTHWQVRGGNFLSLHRLLDDIYTHLQNGQDQMAERIQQLGGRAMGCAHWAVQQSKIPPLNRGENSADLLKIIDEDLKAVSKSLKQAILTIEPLKDPVTVDIFTEIMGVLDKDWWQMNASRD